MAKEAKVKDDGTIDREVLVGQLNRLKPALRSGGAIPELGHFWFEDGTVSSYDGGLGIRSTSSLDLEGGVPGKALIGLLGTSSLKQVGVDVAKTAITVKLGRSRTKLVTLGADRNPWNFPVEPEGKAIEISEALVEALRSALVVKASSPNRREHYGIFVYREKNVIDIYSTDTFTLVRASIEEKKSKLPEFLFLPRPFVEQIVSQLPRGADLYVSDDCLSAVSEGIEVHSNVLESDDLADMGAVVESAYTEHPEKDVPMPAGLEAALDRASVLAGSSDADVTITIKEKDFHLDGKYKYGELKERLKLDEAHPETELTMSVVLLRRALLTCDTFSAIDESMAFFGGDSFFYLASAKE